MIDHKCQYAELIGKRPEWQTDDKGMTVCRYCHHPKEAPTKKAAPTRNLRKSDNGD